MSLPFNLEPYRAFLLVLVFAWVVALIRTEAGWTRPGHGKALAALRPGRGGVVSRERRSADSAEGVKSLSFMLSYIAVFLLITSTVESIQQAEKLIAWIVVGGVLVSLAALYEGVTTTTSSTISTRGSRRSSNSRGRWWRYGAGNSVSSRRRSIRSRSAAP